MRRRGQASGRLPMCPRTWEPRCSLLLFLYTLLEASFDGFNGSKETPEGFLPISIGSMLYPALSRDFTMDLSCLRGNAVGRYDPTSALE